MAKAKDERASMFNAAQRQDIEEKNQVAKAQDGAVEKKEEMIFTVRIPEEVWDEMMRLKIKTKGKKSLNKQVNEALEQYLNL